MKRQSLEKTSDITAADRLRALKWAFPLTIPVMAGYVFLGITYGILMVTHGLPPWLPVVTAAVIYTGSMEFLMADILVSSFNPASAFATALMVGARHIFYGLSMLDKYRGMGWKKFYLIYTTSDETFAVNYSAEIPENADRGWFYFWVSLLDQLYWVGGSALGGAFGSLITFNTKGLDFVMTAMFVTIFMNQWLKDGEGKEAFFKNHISEFVGLLASAVCLVIFGPDRFIIPSMIAILALLTVLRPKLEALEAASASVEDGGNQAEDAVRKAGASGMRDTGDKSRKAAEERKESGRRKTGQSCVQGGAEDSETDAAAESAMRGMKREEAVKMTSADHHGEEDKA